MELQDMEEVRVSGEDLYRGKVVHLVKDTVRLPNGKTAIREVIRHIGAVCVVPLTKDGEVVLVRQYRYAHGQVLTEIPAGKLDCSEEDPKEAVLRELREETGYRAGKLTDLGILYTTVAICDEKIHMYLAEDLTPGETDPDEDEFLEILRVPLETLVEQILRGDVPDSKTQAAVLRVWEAKRREGTPC